MATVDDLLYVIYKGLDPNGVCFWKSSSSQPHSECNQLLYYFLQNQQDDSRAKALGRHLYLVTCYLLLTALY